MFRCGDMKQIFQGKSHLPTFDGHKPTLAGGFDYSLPALAFYSNRMPKMHQWTHRRTNKGMDGCQGCGVGVRVPRSPGFGPESESLF